VITGYDHVQLAIPAGGEDVARSFYGGLLGMTERPKPPALAARGGCWFDSGAAVLHLGVDDLFCPPARLIPRSSSPTWTPSAPCSSRPGTTVWTDPASCPECEGCTATTRSATGWNSSRRSAE
jgi:hypothetical protein